MTDSATASLDADIALSAPERADPAWAAVVSLMLGAFSQVTAEFLPASLLTPIANDLGVSVGAAGQVVTATSLVGIVAGLAMAIVTRAMDRRVVLWLLTGLLIVSNLLSATASNLTVLLYLSGGFEGGATEFNFLLSGRFDDNDPVVSVVPEAGMALVFAHRILHRGAPVVSGRKYVLRTDVMYRWQGK